MEKAGLRLPQSTDGTVVELPPLTKGVTIESIQTPTLVTADSEDTPQISITPLSQLKKSESNTINQSRRRCIMNENSDEKTPMVIEMGNIPITLNNNIYGSSYQSSRRLPYDHVLLLFLLLLIIIIINYQ